MLKCSCSIEKLQQAKIEDYTKMDFTEEVKSQVPTLIYLPHISTAEGVPLQIMSDHAYLKSKASLIDQRTDLFKNAK